MGINKSKFNLDDIEFNIDTPSNITKKYCKKCGTENEIESKFCLECGNTKFYDSYEEYEDKKNSKYCIHCKTKLNIKVKFCPDCGKNQFVNSKEELNKLEEQKKESEWNERISKAKKELKQLKDKENLIKNDISNLNNKRNEIVNKYQNDIDLVTKSIEKYQKESVYDKEGYSKKVNKLTKDINKYNDLKTKYDNDLALEKEKYNSLLNNCKELEDDIEQISKYIEKRKKEESDLAARIKKIEANKKLNNGIYVDRKNKQILFGKYCDEEIVWDIIKEPGETFLLISNKCLGVCLPNEINSKINQIYNDIFSSVEKDRLTELKIIKQPYSKIGIFNKDTVVTHMYNKDKRICYGCINEDKASPTTATISWWLEGGKEIISESGRIVDVYSKNTRYGIRPLIQIKK